MTSRREFIKISALGGGMLSTVPVLGNAPAVRKPVVISTWNFGLNANVAAWKILSSEGRALDAVEAGAKVPEADPRETSVGKNMTHTAPHRAAILTCRTTAVKYGSETSGSKHYKHL